MPRRPPAIAPDDDFAASAPAGNLRRLANSSSRGALDRTVPRATAGGARRRSGSRKASATVRPSSAKRDRPLSPESAASGVRGPGQDATPAEKEAIKKRFQQLDHDGDGQLSYEELRNLFKSSRSNMLSDEDAKALFLKVDKNGDGQVGFDEFLDFIFATLEISGVNPLQPEVEIELPLGGGGLQLGGKNGNVVVKAGHVPRVKVGWRAVAVDGARLEPSAIAAALERAKSQQTHHSTITFELSEDRAQSILRHDKEVAASRRVQARRELMELCGCADLESLENEQRGVLLNNRRLPKLLVDAHAVFEAEVLLGTKPADKMSKHLNLVQALVKDQEAEVRHLLSTEVLDMLQKDPDGNTALHLAQSRGCMSAVLALDPSAVWEKNVLGRTPLNEHLAHDESSQELLHEMARTCCEDVVRGALLSSDYDGICAAMRLPEDGAATLQYLPSWEEVLAALSSPAPELLGALEALGGEGWPSLLTYHLFSDVRRLRSHTQQSTERLLAVWGIIARLLDGCYHGDEASLHAVKPLLRATQGPNLPPIDMRLPYRDQLRAAMKHLEGKSETVMRSVYENMQGAAADWLKNELEDNLSLDLLPDDFADLGLPQRLRMDYRLRTSEYGGHVIRPNWIIDADISLEEVFADLERVGMVGQVRREDAVYDMLRLAGMGEDSSLSPFAADMESILVTRCYGAYLRGLCQTQQQFISDALAAALGELAIPGQTFFVRKEAKGYPRIMEKTLQRIEETNVELREADKDHMNVERLNFVLQQSAAFVCDINGATVLADSPEQLATIYNRLVTSLPLLRVKNTYLQNVETAGSYRDIKLFMVVDSPVGPLIVEVQLMLAQAFQEKRWMHLPYEYFRGDMDWHYTRSAHSPTHLFQVAWNLYHSIGAVQDAEDSSKIEELFLSAANQGHFVARGLCYREGWGRFRQDDAEALRLFAAGAQVGIREAKSRLGTSYVGAVRNCSASRKRGLQLLHEAAAEDEPEAMYQLGLHEFDADARIAMLKAAASKGHMRAARHPLIAEAMDSRGRRLRLSSFV